MLETEHDERLGRPVCEVCGEPATNGIGQTDAAAPGTAVLIFLCDKHRPQAAASG